jgi:hypothetical protein
LARVRGLVAELGTPLLLRLMAEVTAEHANALARDGASPQAARLSREAALLRQALDELLQ